MTGTPIQNNLTELWALMHFCLPLVFGTLEEYEWIYAPILFTLLAFFTRNYKIGLSPIVTWDEAQYV